jgi:hypothetical protein
MEAPLLSTVPLSATSSMSEFLIEGTANLYDGTICVTGEASVLVINGIVQLRGAGTATIENRT